MKNKLFLFSMAILLLMVGLVNAAELNLTALNNITSPAIGGDEGQWGYILNNNWASIFSYFTSINEFLFIGQLANGTHNISESEIFDLDKYTKAQTNTLLSDEATIRNDADYGLQSRINLNNDTLSAKDNDLKNQIDLDNATLTNEIINRQNADISLNNAINANNETITTNLNAEITNRGNADNNLQAQISLDNSTLTTNLNSEAVSRNTADDELNSNISTVATNLNNEANIRATADANINFTLITVFNWGDHSLQGYFTLLGLQTDYYNKSQLYNMGEINTMASALNVNITNEKSDRQNADISLNNAINANNETITTNLNAEIINRGNADNNLQAQISLDNSTLTTNLDVEITNRLAADANHFTTANETDPKVVGGSANQAVCWKTTTTLGYCSDVNATTGSCTCN